MMKNRHLFRLVMPILLLTIPIIAVNAQTPIKRSYKSEIQFLLNRYTKAEPIETISYDEEKQVFTGLPVGVEADSLHFLDLPYAVTTKEVKHVDEFLTAKGEWIKMITYISREDLGDHWPNEAKYRLFLEDKVLAFNANLEMIAETPNTVEYLQIHREKGITALQNGLFQWNEFQPITKVALVEARKSGFDVVVNGSEYRFIKDGQALLIYDQEHLYTGQKQLEGKVEVERKQYYQRTDAGYLIPSHTWVEYPAVLPTGINVMKRELLVTTNFTITGERYRSSANNLVSRNAAIKITPNPAGQMIYCQLMLPNLPDNALVIYQVEDLAGKVLLTVQKRKAEQTSGINIAHLPAGVYMLKVLAGRQSFQEKFVKTNQ